MPRDQWAIDRARERGLQAKLYGEFETAGETKQYAPKPPKPTPRCKCGSRETTERWETFRNGSEHIRLSCAKCKRFIKWLSHSLAK